MDMKELGFTQEELQERVIERVCEKLLRTPDSGEPRDGDDDFVPLGYTELKKGIETKIQVRIDRAINELADKHILPNAAKMVEEITLTKTNEWGEKKGAPITFVEYLVARADAYIREEVNYAGETRAQSRDGYSWKAHGTRIAVMIDKHLNYSIQSAMEAATKSANNSIAGGIEAALKISLADIAQRIKIEAKTNR